MGRPRSADVIVTKQPYWKKVYRKTLHHPWLRKQTHTIQLAWYKLILVPEREDGRCEYDGEPLQVKDISDLIGIREPDLQAALRAFEGKGMVSWDGETLVLVNHYNFQVSRESARVRRHRNIVTSNVTSNAHETLQETGEEEEDSILILEPSYSPEARMEKGKKERRRKPTSSPSSSKFVPPTVGDVKARIAEMGYHFDAETFVAFYQSKGWRVGNQPMKDWKAACVTFEKRHENDSKAEPEKDSYWYGPSLPRVNGNGSAH